MIRTVFEGLKIKSAGSMILLVISVTLLSNGYLSGSENEFHLTPLELKLWNDPAFQKAFTESYIAETEIEPRVTVDEREEMQDILEKISDDNISEAVKILRKNLNEASSAVFDFTLANIYFQQEEFAKASRSYEQAVKKYPKFRRAWKNLGLIHVRQSRFDDAVQALTKVVELGGGDSVTYGLLGYSYSSVTNHISAESAYRMAILLDGRTLDWKMGLARSFFKQERFNDAVSLCGKLIEDYPERADLWLLQANAYIGMGKAIKAAEIYEFVDVMGKATTASLNMLGDIYINEELYDNAVDAYVRAMEKDTNGSSDRAMRAAKVLAGRGALEQTEQMVEHIIESKGKTLETKDRIDLLKLKARIAVAEGSSEDEVEVLRKIVELDPLDGEALLLLGQNSARNGETEEAINYYERAANIEGYEADAKVRHAQLLVKNGKYMEALPLLKRAQQVKPRENIQKYLEQVERIAK